MFAPLRLRTQYLLLLTLAALLPLGVAGLIEWSLLARTLPQQRDQLLQKDLYIALLLRDRLRLNHNAPIPQQAAQQVYVVDAQGQVVIHPDPELVRRHRNLSLLPPVKALLTRPIGTMVYPVEGHTQLAAYVAVGNGWGIVVVETAPEELPNLFLHGGLIPVVALVLLGTLGFAVWLGEQASAPLQRLSEGMQRLSLSDTSAPDLGRVNALELQVLVDSFNAMSQRIQQETRANRDLLAGLAAEKNKLELIIEALTEGILVYDLSGQVLTANGAFYQLVQQSVTHWQQLPLCDLSGVRIRPTESAFNRAISQGPLTTIRRLLGTNSILQITVAPLKNSNGEVMGAVAVLRDVTSQKEGERLREDFVATLTHDLRTPLLAASQALQTTLGGHYGSLSAQQQQVLTAVVESNRELIGLVESLLAIYRYEAGRMELRREPTALAGFISQCLTELQPLAQTRQVHLSLAPSAHLPLVPCDRSQLRRVVTNLVDNALKFTPSGGQVTVRIVPVSQGIEVAVQDTGRGIPPERQAQLFVRFAQSSGYGTGTGLGLYLCRQIVEAHGGKIWAQSSPDHGSTFYFVLPMEEKR